MNMEQVVADRLVQADRVVNELSSQLSMAVVELEMLQSLTKQASNGNGAAPPPAAKKRKSKNDKRRTRAQMTELREFAQEHEGHEDLHGLMVEKAMVAEHEKPLVKKLLRK